MDLRRFLREGEVSVRDNNFIIGHHKEPIPINENLNFIRDIFRFTYIYYKTGHCFIHLFKLRWVIASLIKLFLKPSMWRQIKNEIQAILFSAPVFSKKNCNKYDTDIRAWRKFFFNIKLEKRRARSIN